MSTDPSRDFATVAELSYLYRACRVLLLGPETIPIVSTMAPTQYQQLTEDDVNHFMQHGYVKLSNCFTQEQADGLTSTLWKRLGMSPTDKSTWHTERINMPSHTTFEASEFAPKAWAAICDLVGGEQRVGDTNRTWNDGLIVNLGTPEGEGKDILGKELPGWHVDGDFFVHLYESSARTLS